jgi:hypothetical protein
MTTTSTNSPARQWKHLHVLQGEKFTAPFIDFICREFNESEHLFLVRHSDAYPAPQRDSVVLFGRPGGRWHKLLLMVKTMNRAEKIFLHSLFYLDVMVVLLAQPWLLRKCHWLVWGADLYGSPLPAAGLMPSIAERVASRVKRKVGHIVTYLRGDYELARRRLGAVGRYRECLMYTSNVFKPQAISSQSTRGVADAHVTKVLLGNSADPSNKHAELFERVASVMKGDVRLYCPLSYGDRRYATEVAALGRARFGECFVPLLDLMPLPDYLALLEGLDIAIFAHDRQQAMGNTVQLLGLGKKVYMRSDVTHWELLREQGIVVYDVDELTLEVTAADRVALRDNQCRVAEYFSESRLVQQYRQLFLSCEPA